MTLSKLFLVSFDESVNHQVSTYCENDGFAIERLHLRTGNATIGFLPDRTTCQDPDCLGNDESLTPL